MYIHMNNMVTSNPISKNSPIPLYYQLKEWLLSQIEDGTLQIGCKAPTEIELAEQLHISRGTVRQALTELAKEGWLYRVQGHGTFVSGKRVDHGVAQQFNSFAEDMREKHVPFSSELLSRQLMVASPLVSARLQLSPSQRVVFLERLGSVNDAPIVIANTYLPADLCQPILDEDMTNASLYEILESKYGLKLAHATRTLWPGLADPHEATHLRIAEGAPIHIMETVAYLQNGRVVEYSKLRYRGDRNRFVFEVSRRTDSAPV